MAGRLARFLKLEQPQRGAEAPQHEVATVARFRGEPSGIALEPDFGEQPFLRCPQCEADNTRYAERCQNCQARLTGEDVRAWNAQLWAARKTAEAETAKSEPAQVAQPLTPDAQRLLGEAIAREVGERERARLSWWSSETARDATPAGMRLLAMLPTRRARTVVGAAALLTFVAGALVALAPGHHPAVRGAGLLVSMLLLVLFTPNLPRRNRWWDGF
ncbi:MAG TPA: hypothetical protein VFL36_06310 [Myxococcales bacterium]|nr:hypothetical protein [Myxococcales bacterium]